MARREHTRQPDRDSVLVHNSREEIERAEKAILDAARRHDYPDRSMFALRLALEEAVINAFKHGHRSIPDKPVELRWTIDDAFAEITIEDQGPGFDPCAVPDPTSQDRLELPTGRGIMLMNAYMSRVEYNERGNRVTMIHEPDRAPPD